MKESTRNLLVGLFVIASLGALGVLMVWFGETPTWLRTSDWQLSIYGVEELRGVGDGSPVKLNGVEIGRVAGVDFRDREKPEKGVVINAMIKRQYSIPRGAYAKVYGATLGIGSGFVNIVIADEKAEGLLPKEDAIVRGEMASLFNELIPPEAIDSFQRTVDEIGNFASAAVPVAKNLETLLEQRDIEDVDTEGPEAVAANISTVVERIDRFVANLNQVLGDVNVQEDVKGVVRDLKDASDDLKKTFVIWKERSIQLADNANEAIDNTEADLRDALKVLNRSLHEISKAATSLASVMRDVEQGRGTAGLLVKDERLYESAVLALRRLNEVLSNMATITAKFRDDGYITIAMPSLVGPVPVRKIEVSGEEQPRKQ